MLEENKNTQPQSKISGSYKKTVYTSGKPNCRLLSLGDPFWNFGPSAEDSLKRRGVSRYPCAPHSKFSNLASMSILKVKPKLLQLNFNTSTECQNFSQYGIMLFQIYFVLPKNIINLTSFWQKQLLECEHIFTAKDSNSLWYFGKT